MSWKAFLLLLSLLLFVHGVLQGDNNKVWFAKLLVLFSYTSSSGCEIEAAFVRWRVAKRPAVKDKKLKSHFGAAEMGRREMQKLISQYY